MVKTVLGVKCSRDALDWAVLEGADRSSARRVAAKRVVAPQAVPRGEQLVWVRKEVHELLEKFAVQVVVIRVAEPGGQGNSLPRAEVEGVVQEAVAAAGTPCRRMPGVSLRSAFSAKNGTDLEKAAAGFDVVADTPKTRRDPVTAALAALEA